MIAFKIDFRNQTFLLGKEFSSSIFLSQNYDHYHLDVGGSEIRLNEVIKSHTWIDTKLTTGESIEITIVENNCASSEPIKSKIPFSPSQPLYKEDINEFHTRMLEKLYTLETLLKQEGLIE